MFGAWTGCRLPFPLFHFPAAFAPIKGVYRRNSRTEPTDPQESLRVMAATRIAIVTGAASVGMGRAIALRLASVSHFAISETYSVHVIPLRIGRFGRRSQRSTTQTRAAR